VGQRLILFKTLPSKTYLDEKISDGTLRAAMTFLPGTCYAGAGIYPETAAYSSPMSYTGSGTGSGCPDPEDTVACKEWEVLDFLQKHSFGFPQAFNAFVFVELRAGFRTEWERHAVQVSRDLREELAADAQPEYLAAGHLNGCGSYNAVFEFLTSDHARLQRCILRLTDKEYVLDTMVGHLAADDAKGFGEPGRKASSRAKGKAARR
jgi:hypothetical protein